LNHMHSILAYPDWFKVKNKTKQNKTTIWGLLTPFRH
jgi:hypothetical protein